MIGSSSPGCGSKRQLGVGAIRQKERPIVHMSDSGRRQSRLGLAITLYSSILFWNVTCLLLQTLFGHQWVPRRGLVIMAFCATCILMFLIRKSWYAAHIEDAEGNRS